jgi:hypothetical protein
MSNANASYRGPAFTGDFTAMTGKVVDKMIDENGRTLVQVTVRMANQKDVTLATATDEIALPKK